MSSMHPTTIMVHYLAALQDLYKEVVVAPNTHLISHIRDFMQLWGPPAQTHEFAFERFQSSHQSGGFSSPYVPLKHPLITSVLR